MEQKIITAREEYRELDKWIEEHGRQKIFLVCGNSVRNVGALYAHLKNATENARLFERFSDFHPNPDYASVARGAELFRRTNCGAIMAIGGGSAMDVAKCVKLFCRMDENKNYLEQKIVPNRIPFLAAPTTAGTGSEATRFAVIYYNGVKQSVTDESCIPDTVLMDSGTLKSLPAYQRKSSMMDALCHAIESCWSVNATETSRAYGAQAITKILSHMDGYLSNTDAGNEGMLYAAHMAGKSINIAQTTAGHAMCYGITSLFRIAHGHAAALCVRVLFPWMAENMPRLDDSPEKARLQQAFHQIAASMGCDCAASAANRFLEIFKSLELAVPVATEQQIRFLSLNVNPTRLKNNPIFLDGETISSLYRAILSGEAS